MLALTAFLPGVALLGFGDYQQLTGQPLPQIDNEFTTLIATSVFGYGVGIASRLLLQHSLNKRTVDIKDKLKSQYLQADSIYKTYALEGAGLFMLGTLLALNGGINHNYLNLGLGILMGSGGATYMQRGILGSKNTRISLKEVIGPKRA